MNARLSALLAVASVLTATTGFAQTSGTSHPEALDDNITTLKTPSVTAPPTVPVQPTAAASVPVLHDHNVDAEIVTAAPPQTATVVKPQVSAPKIDPADAGIVTSYAYSDTALLEGTLIKARLNEQISTSTSKSGTRFTAQLSQPVEHAGAVIFPAGSVLSGRITEVRGGHRIRGAAAIHIEPDTLTLPDGSSVRISARVIDLDAFHDARVNDEGTILRSDHTKRTITELGLTTGSAAVAGAVIGGGAGALVGAGIGAGVGTVWWLKQDRQQTLREGTEIVFSLTRPMELGAIPHGR